MPNQWPIAIGEEKGEQKLGKERFDSFKTAAVSVEVRQALCFRGLVLDLINTRVSV